MKFSFRHVLVALSLVLVLLGSACAFSGHTIPAHAALGNKPCAKWLAPANGVTFIKGKPQTISVRAYPCSPGDPCILLIEIHIMFRDNTLLGSSNILCRILQPDPGTTDHFSCSSDGNGDPVRPTNDGPIQLGFGAYDTGNGYSRDPDGLITGTYSSGPVPPTPTSTPSPTPISSMGTENVSLTFNYAGYASSRSKGQSAKYVNVSGRWIVPSITSCPQKASLTTGVWVGLYGSISGSPYIEQTGT